MRGTLTVLRFELERFRLLPVAGMLLGLGALTVPWLPAYRTADADTVRLVAALAAAAGLVLVAALGVGSAIMAPDERRESFSLARPVGVFSLWLGRLLAALLLAVAAPALALAPAVIVSARHGLPIDIPNWLLPVLLVLPGLVCAAGLVRLMVRARSVWLAALVLGVGVLWIVQARLLWAPAFRVEAAVSTMDRWGALALVLGIGAAVWVVPFALGSAAAARYGADPARASARGGAAALLSLAVAVTLAWGILAWMFAASPGDLEGITLVGVPPDGSVFVLDGRVRRVVRYPQAFLADGTTGRWERIPALWSLPYLSAIFDEHGTRMAALRFEPNRRGSLQSVVVRDLAEGDGRTRAVPVPLGEDVLFLALSSGGSKLLTVFEGHVVVWEVETGRPLARAPWEGARPVLAEVEDDGGLWLVPRPPEPREGPAVLRVLRFSPGGRALETAWELGGVIVPRLLRTAGEGEGRVVPVVAADPGHGRRLSVRGLEDGVELWSVPLEDPRAVRQVLPLEPGAVAVVLADGSGHAAALELVTPEGLRWHRELGRTNFAAVAPGPTVDTLTLSIGPPEGMLVCPLTTGLVNLADGAVTQLGRGVRPAVAAWFQWQLPRPGSPGARLFVRDTDLLHFTGEGRLEPLSLDGGR